MLIAVCDDNALFREDIKVLLDEYKKEKRIAIDIAEYENGKLLLESRNIFDMVFMDYLMPDIDGLETARQLRNRKYNCSIIFVTSYPEFILDSFEVQPFRFFIKPIEKEKLFSAMDSYIRQQKMLNPIMIVENNERHIIKTEDIIYIEADGRNSLIRTKECTYKSSKNISKIGELLPKYCFCRVHKAYIINMHCISAIRKNEITLINGEKAIISRTIFPHFKKIYSEFVKNFTMV